MFYLKKFYFIIYILLMCRRSMFVRFIVRVAPQSVFSFFTDAITVCLDCKEVRNSLVFDWSVTLMRTITSLLHFLCLVYLMLICMRTVVHTYTHCTCFLFLRSIQVSYCVMYVTMNNYHKVDSLTNEKSMLPFSAMVMISKHSKVVY